MSNVEEWFIPACTGTYYDGKEVNYAIGPKVDGKLPDPGGITVIDKSLFDSALRDLSQSRRLALQLTSCLDIAEKALEKVAFLKMLNKHAEHTREPDSIAREALAQIRELRGK